MKRTTRKCVVTLPGEYKHTNAFNWRAQMLGIESRWKTSENQTTDTYSLLSLLLFNARAQKFNSTGVNYAGKLNSERNDTQIACHYSSSITDYTYLVFLLRTRYGIRCNRSKFINRVAEAQINCYTCYTRCWHISVSFWIRICMIFICRCCIILVAQLHDFSATILQCRTTLTLKRKTYHQMGWLSYLAEGRHLNFAFKFRCLSAFTPSVRCQRNFAWQLRWHVSK